MNGEFRLFPQRASSVGAEVDALYFFLIALSSFFIVIIAGCLMFFAVRYRRTERARYPRPVLDLLKLELAWSIGPLLLALGLFAWGARVFVRMQTPPSDAMQVYVVGKQWMWKIDHPNGRREINELHVPVGRPVELKMISEDVIHSFFVPAFRVKQDVLPGRYTTLWFEATQAGEYHLFCAEFCGTDHSQMTGRVVVLEPADYQRWLAGSLNERPLADKGEQVFRRLACDGCHGQGDAMRRGPRLTGRFGKPVQLASGATVVFDEQYVRESILQPRKKIVAGYPAIMPSYQNQITEAEILTLIDYLKRDGSGQASGAEPSADSG